MGIHEAHLPLYVSLPDIEKCHTQDSNLFLRIYFYIPRESCFTILNYTPIRCAHKELNLDRRIKTRYSTFEL